MTAFDSVAKLHNRYMAMMKGATTEMGGEITPGKRLNRLLDQYPEFTFRVMLH